MKRCNRCGFENKNEHRFCQNCGEELNGSKPANKNLIERFRQANVIIKIIIIVIAVFIFLLVMPWIAHIFFGMPLESYTEGDATYRSSQFDSLDLDGNGALSFNEVEGLASDISYDDLLVLFEAADKNGNGVLKGSEFDGYLYRIDKYYKSLENQNKDSSYSSSSTSSKSVKYVEICPECGSRDETIEYVTSGGYTVYQCSACGYESYDEEDFYVEASGIKCILPVFKDNLAIGGDYGG